MLNRFFATKQESSPAPTDASLMGPRVPRHSGGWVMVRKRLQTEQGLRVLDVGYTSPANVHYIAGLGHSIFLADIVEDACTGNWQNGDDEEGNPIWNVEGFLEKSLDFAGRTFDVALLWTSLDYLPEPLVAPVVEHLFQAMNPDGQALALFHTRMKGEETVHCRFHVTDSDDVEVQLARPFPIQRAFTNRSIERLFAGWTSHRQFLAKDSVSEVVMTR